MEFRPVKKRNLSDGVKESLYQYIKNMDVKKNTKLPSEDMIAQSVGVSRVTVRKALADLEQEGVVFKIQGKGTFVNPEALQIKVTINIGRENISDKELSRSMFEILRKRSGKIISWDKIEIYISNKDKLKNITSYVDYMENDGFLAFETANYDQENNAVFFDYEIYDTNYIRFNIIRQKQVKYNEIL